MRTTKKKLIVGALYSVCSQDPDERGRWEVLRWNGERWIGVRGKPSPWACNGTVDHVRFKDAPPEWQVVLLSERVRKLEKAGDEMAKWFPSSSTHRERVVGQWTEVRRMKP